MNEPKPDILEVVEREGIDLRRFKALCPFHEEKTPSFTVNPNKQYFHCFGCGAHGDVVDFIQKKHAVNFKQALIILGIRRGRRPAPDPAQERRQTLLKAYTAWKKEKYMELCDQAIEIHALRIKASSARGTRSLPEHLAWFMAEQLAKLPKIENDLNIFLSKDDEQIFEILEGEPCRT